MKLVFKLAISVIVVMGLIVVGDFFNFPLWPVDFLAPRIPVEFTFRLDGYDSKVSDMIIRRSQGVKMSILTEKEKQKQILCSDKTGIIRTVLQVGNYRVNASMAAVYKGEFHGFYAVKQTRENLLQSRTLIVRQDDQNILITLYPVHRETHDFLIKSMTAYLETGNIDVAGIVARNIAPSFADDIETIIELKNMMDALPTSAYNSRINYISEMIYILGKYCSKSNLKIQLPDEIIYLNSRVKALKRSRDRVIRAHLELMNEFMEKKRLKSVVEEWEHIVNNMELYPENVIERAIISKKLSYYEEVIPEIESQLSFEIEHRFRESVDNYNMGDLEAARVEFTLLLTDIQTLGFLKEFLEIKESTRSYLDDISLIFSARQAIRDNQLQEALIMLDTVLQPNDLVYRRIEETKQFMRMQNVNTNLID